MECEHSAWSDLELLQQDCVECDAGYTLSEIVYYFGCVTDVNLLQDC